MIERLKQISPKTRLVFLGLVFVLLPALVLSYLGFRSANERAENSRASFEATVGLLHDKIESDGVRIEQDILNIVLEKQKGLRLDGNVQEWLWNIASAAPVVSDPFLATSDGRVISYILSLKWEQRRQPASSSTEAVARKIRTAEQLELVAHDFTRARDIYDEAITLAVSPSDLALAIERAARSSYKMGTYAEGIRRYQQLLGQEYERVTVARLPAPILALSELIDGYTAVHDSLQVRSTLLALYRRLLVHPWDLNGGEYLYYLSSTSAAIRRASLLPGTDDMISRELEIQKQARTIREASQYIVPQLESNFAGSSISNSRFEHIFIQRPETALLFCCFRFTPLPQGSGWVAFGFAPRRDYVLSHVIPDILNSVDLGPDVVAGIVDVSGNILAAQKPVQRAQFLAARDLPGLFDSWKIVLFDRKGRTIDELVAGEKRFYLLILLGTALAMLAGITITVRAALQEMEAARLKTDFVASVSHELKTPLSLIRMFSETLDSGLSVSEDQRREFIGIIRAESERLTHLINNLLDFSRMESRARKYRMQSTNFVDIARRVLEAQKFRLHELQCVLDTALPDHPITINADADAIGQAILNLLDNALKYSFEEKHICIDVRAEQNQGVFAIRDHGEGILQTELRQVFDKFFRGSSQKTKETRGTGLGLCIAKEIVEAHGGSIEVESTPGEGSTFTIRIPLLGARV